jgi:hypothetical protein
LDTSKNKIAVGVLRWGEQIPDVETIFNDEVSLATVMGPGCCHDLGTTWSRW